VEWIGFSSQRDARQELVPEVPRHHQLRKCRLWGSNPAPATKSGRLTERALLLSTVTTAAGHTLLLLEK
jgi:hypothetical protein